MSLYDFINEMIRCLSDKMGDSYLIIPKKILKNNSIELDYLVIQKCLENVAPCICVNPMYLEYLNGKSIESMVDHVIKIYENSQRMRESELVSLCNFENAEEKIVFRLINYKKNKKMLENLIYDRVQDLAIIYLLVLSCQDDCEMTVKLDKTNIEYFCLTHEDIRKHAFINTERIYPPVFERLDKLIMSAMFAKNSLSENIKKEAARSFESMSSPNMYVLTTSKKENGAGCILYNGIMERIHMTLNSDYYIIPSSVNEVLIIPDEYAMGKDCLEKMVLEVNRDHVPAGEILSDRVYHFPEDQFEVCPEEDSSVSS